MRQGAGFFFKVPDSVKVLYRKNKQIVGVPDKPAYCDFAGMLPTGRFVGFDAKHTEHKTSWPFSELSDFQRWALRMTAAHGGIAFVYVRRIVTPLQWKDYAFPVDDNGVIAGVTDRKSMPWGERSAPFEIPRAMTWLDVIVERHQ
jgi:Penicillin-binding protein-related factor A, putative recombinase